MGRLSGAGRGVQEGELVDETLEGDPLLWRFLPTLPHQRIDLTNTHKHTHTLGEYSNRGTEAVSSKGTSCVLTGSGHMSGRGRSEEHTSELQSR